MKPTIDIVIPHYNGLSLLQKHLPRVIVNSPEVQTIIVVDNASNDGSDTYLQKFSKVRVIHNQTNLGFTMAINQGVKSSDADFIVLINNDVSPQSGYIKKTLPFFEDSTVFAVNFNETNSSWPKVWWSEGKLQYERGSQKEKSLYSLWASGGSAIYRKTIWDKLSGFNEIYSPGYWEDIDLGWRAWRAGYKIIWQPEGQVIHEHESSFRKLNTDYVNALRQRNELLFIWQNITEKSKVTGHRKFLLTYTLKHPGYIKIIFSALAQSSRMISPTNGLSDSQILQAVNNPL